MCCNKVLNKSLSIIIASLIIAVQIIAVIPTITLAASDTNVMKITTKAHVQDIGWMSPVTTNSDGNVSGMGTTHQSKRMEALQISLDAPAGVNLKYRAHIQDIGWTGWVTISSGNRNVQIGTTGQSKRMEAIQIVAENLEGYELQYRAHVQDIGWMNWITAGNSVSTATLDEGTFAGTTHMSKRVESIEMRIVPTSKVEVPDAEANVNQTPAPSVVPEVTPTATPSATPEEKPTAEPTAKPENNEEVAPKDNAELLPDNVVESIPENNNSGVKVELAVKEETKKESPKPQVPNHEHIYDEEWVLTKPATCYEQGIETKTCKICGATITRTVKSHVLQRAERLDVTATCTRKGQTYYECTLCGQLFFNYTMELGHDWDNVRVEDSKVSCTTDGVTSIHCKRPGCTDVKDVNITPATGHSYKEVTTPATCTEKGSIADVCSTCGETHVRTTLRATGHNYSSYIPDNNATCTADGTKTSTCLKCGDKKSITDYGTKKAHQYYSLNNAVEATCVKDGKESDEKCSVCGYIKRGTKIKGTHQFEYRINDSKCTGKETYAHCTLCDYSTCLGPVSFGKGHTWDGRTCTVCDTTTPWWRYWINSSDRSGAIWFVTFTCEINKCFGFDDHSGNTNVTTILEGRRGDRDYMSVTAPSAKSGFVFDGWYDLATGQKVPTSGSETRVSGTTITVHWKDMDKGFEARYVSGN